MKKNEIKVGGLYLAKVSGSIVTVRVDEITMQAKTRYSAGGTRYHVTNLKTGRQTVFKSAMKFRSEARGPAIAVRSNLEDSAINESLGKKADNSAPHVIIIARAGTGKTTTGICGLEVLKGKTPTLTPSPQQAKVWEEFAKSKGVRSIAMVAFNKSIATELQSRVPEGVDAMTLHSLGNSAVRKSLGYQQPNSFTVQDAIAEIEQRDIREIRKYDFDAIKATEKLVGLAKQNLLGWDSESFDSQAITDDDFNRLASYYDVDLNGGASKVYRWTRECLDRSLSPQGKISFDDMIWLPIVLNLSVNQYDLLFVDEAQDLNRCQQALAKKSGSRLIFCGDDKQCQPEGTLVRVTGKSNPVPIESLNVGDLLITYNPNSSRFNGKRTQGRKVEKINSRDYEGGMYYINESRSTPNHRWLTRFKSDVPKDQTALYLIELEDGTFRVGITQLVFTQGFGPALRARQRGAVKLWVLETYPDRLSAREMEFKCSMKYRIPQLAAYENQEDSWCYDLVESGVVSDVEELLTDYDRIYDYPIWEKGNSQHIGKYSYVTQACNLIQGVNEMCTWVDGEPSWTPLEITIESDWIGKVYSLQVQPTEKGKRLYVSDDVVTHNSIYGFAGADSESLKRLEAELGETDRGVTVLPLTVTRRCGKAIVKEAQAIVPDFEAHESNGEGTISRASYDNENENYRSLVQPGDMCLCRVNAPLVSECFKFLKNGQKANIQGRDVGQGLISTIKKLKASDIADLSAKLSDWLHSETQKENAKRNPNEARLIALQDRSDCLGYFMEGQSTIESVISRIQSVFTDDKTTPGIMFSSVHKSKGLEACRIFLLEPEKATIPHPMAKSEWQKEAEWNLKYVAITRAIEELIYVK